ncbi:STAS domain-containing protein [Streptomyces minutiscleroticus]|uniref:Anti-sigma factor antagonist n=1 Tax=Streptomyces minutiscleroticus TaxID=68238 RepID=A0A918NSI7_9ACTN|nr:STAS domain-containing protein [Streptomyces minutiscleroticus]GGX92400.1 anti-sigma-B factor antagonist [Streptomyces minutiscleroticus]
MTDFHGAADLSQLAVIRTATTTTGTEQVTVLHLHGEIDLYTAPRLRQALTTATARGVPRLVVDLAGVSFTDSSGINALLAAYRATRSRSGWLRLAGLRPAVERAVRFSGLDVVFDCYPTLEQALTA